MNASSDTVIFRDRDYAHGVQRLIAVAIDLFLSLLLFATPNMIAMALWVPPEVREEPDRALQRELIFKHLGPTTYYSTLAVGIVLVLAYQILLRRLRGGTIGYRIARIRLVCHDGSPPPWPQLLKRIGLMVLSIFTWGLVFVPAFLRTKRQALHDQLAATWMVHARAMPTARGQLIYKTRLLGTFPITLTDVEPADPKVDAVAVPVATPAESADATAREAT